MLWRLRPKKIKINYSPTGDKFPSCKAQIAQLTKQVEDLRKKEKEIEGSVLSSIKYLIDREAHVGIKHVVDALQLDS